MRHDSRQKDLTIRCSGIKTGERERKVKKKVKEDPLLQKVRRTATLSHPCATVNWMTVLSGDCISLSDGALLSLTGLQVPGGKANGQQNGGRNMLFTRFRLSFYDSCCPPTSSSSSSSSCSPPSGTLCLTALFLLKERQIVKHPPLRSPTLASLAQKP